MEKLNQIIESMALAQYKAETKTIDQQNAFMLEHATIKEFFDYFSSKKVSTGETWLEQYGHYTLGGLQGLCGTFCLEVLWPKLKDKYIENVVKGLESRLDAQYKVTIEQI
jgi:hypothetical protein